jgi:hypothetical protein
MATLKTAVATPVAEKTNAHADIESALTAYQAEHAKFEAGNSAAGTRARKALAELGKAVKARRNEITETKNARKEAKA